MAVESSSSSPPSFPLDQEQYDVFLSFRGEDTRLNFTSHLHAALCRKNILTFIDDKQIERGDEISSTLLKAIERSKISIVIFSEKYATSRWCLDELVKIMECKKTIIPIFYHIDPKYVRNQSGPYEDAFAEHEMHNQLKVLKWRTTLKEVGSIAGWTSLNRSESELVESIVEDVLQKLNHNISPKVPSWLVGINNRMAEVQPLLCIGSTDVRIIGIWGMSGIGKTIIAEVLFDTLSLNFQGCCFVRNVREKWKNNKQGKLRKKLLAAIVGDHLHVSIGPSISPFVVQKLQSKKALIVLDDVNDIRQIQYLVGEKSWFGPGSRIIVTTRNKDVLRTEDILYEVKPMSTEEALRLLNSKAFCEDQPKIDFIQLSNEVVAYSRGIPLVLEVLGSLLHSKSPKEWKRTLQKLKKVPNEEIHQVLSLSYEELDSDDQKIFLDIACFLKGHTKCHIEKILDGCSLYTDIGLKNLHNKSLITISEYNKVGMHDLIQEMGWNIVRQESANEIEKQNRLWNPEDIYLLLKSEKDTNYSVETISLDMSQIKDIEIKRETFARMSKLRLLSFYMGWLSKVRVSEASFESLPDTIRYFCWDYFPLKVLPSSFCWEMLVELNLRGSRIERLWDAEPDLANLKSFCLMGSDFLIELSNLSKAKNLEEINLDNCTRLQKVSSSIFSLPRLLAVNLSNCINLRAVQSDMVSRSLRWLNLGRCSSLVKFSIGSQKLEYLNLGGTAINHLPTSVQRAKNLIQLSIFKAKRLKKVPPIIETSWSIRKLDLDYCSNLSELPDSLGLLRELNSLSLSESNIETLPESIKLLSKLRYLDVHQCKRLRYLPELPASLRGLYAAGCISLKTVASSAAATQMKNCFGSQNRRFLSRQIPGLEISPRHKDYPECFEFQDCTELKENALQTIVAEAIIRIQYAAYLLSINDDPYHQFHFTIEDFDTQNFEDTCREHFITELPTFPPWEDIQETESSALTVKVNANCCKECKASPIAFGLCKSENTDLGFGRRHTVCLRHFDEHDLRPQYGSTMLYGKLTHNNVSFNFPGTRVPSCFRYRARKTTGMIIFFPAHSHVLGFAFSLVLSPRSCHDFYSITCTCYMGTRNLTDAIRSECSYQEKPKSVDTVFLWYDTVASNWILEKRKYNCPFSFEFSISKGGNDRTTIGIQDCGVWPIYASDLVSENPTQSMELELQPIELGGGSASGIEEQDENCGVWPIYFPDLESENPTGYVN